MARIVAQSELLGRSPPLPPPATARRTAFAPPCSPRPTPSRRGSIRRVDRAAGRLRRRCAIVASSSARAAGASRSARCRTSPLSRSAGAMPSRPLTSAAVIRSLPTASSCSSSDWLSRIEPAARLARICSASARSPRPRLPRSGPAASGSTPTLDAGEIEPLAARQDRDRNLLRLGRGEDELHMLGRLFERLQQGVERLLREHVDFVDDVDLVTARGWAAPRRSAAAGESRRCRGCWRRRFRARRRRRRSPRCGRCRTRCRASASGRARS